MHWVWPIAILLAIAGCAWNTDYRERQQPENYLDQTSPIVIP